MIRLYLFLVLVLGGCSFENPYIKYYKPSNKIDSSKIEPLYEKDPTIIYVKNFEEAAVYYQEARKLGSDIIGSSAFIDYSLKDYKKNIVEAARSVGAAFVLFYMETLGTESGVVPYSYSVPTTNYTYGQVGGVPYSGYTTSSQQYTNYIPYSRTKYWFDATFFAKIKKEEATKQPSVKPKKSNKKHKIKNPPLS